MKKIVAGLAALAMAASVFAVDIAADMYLEGDIATWTQSTKTFSALQLKTWNADNDGNHRAITLSASTDTVGATFGLATVDIQLAGYSLWFKPVDSLKVTFGNVGTKNIAFPNFADWNAYAAFWPYGAQVDFTKDAFAMTCILGPGADTSWFSIAKGTKFWDAINPFWFDARYTTSAGTIQLYAGKGLTIANVATSYSWKPNFAVGLAWAHMPWQQNGYYADVCLVMDDSWKVQTIGGNIGGQLYFGALKLEAFSYLTYATEAWGPDWGTGPTKAKGFRATPEFKVSYALDAGTVSLRGNLRDVQDKTFTIIPAWDATFGAMTYEIAVNVDFDAGKFKSISVPFFVEMKL